MLYTLAPRETEVKVHTFGDTLSELKGMETFHTLSETVAKIEVESFGDTQVEVNGKALGKQIANKTSRSKG